MRLMRMLAAGLGIWATGAAAQSGLDPDYRPLVAPLSAMLSGCLEQGYDEESDTSCESLTSRACEAMGPGGSTTYGMVMCNSVLLPLWDAELNRLWPLVREGLDAKEDELLLAEQRAWVAYKEAACDYAVAQVAGGSMAAHVGGGCLIEKTAERVAEFREILRYR